MKQESMLSQMSNLSHLSNVSYRGAQPDYQGSQIFKESLTPGQNFIFPPKLSRQEEIGIDSLGFSDFKHITPQKESAGAFTFWTKELNENIQGTSDNEQEEVGAKSGEESEVGGAKSKEESGLVKREESEEGNSMGGEEKRMKNETKNIPKNFGKAIIIFIEKNQPSLEATCHQYGISFLDLLERLRSVKKKINTIADLRNLWGDNEEGRCIRVISNYFLRKHSLHYIYNSRIKTRVCHSKYKRRLQEALLNPFDFNHIKEY